MGKPGRGERKRKMKNEMVEDDIASLPLSSTRAGTAYLPPDVAKVDVTKVDAVKSNLTYSIFAPRTIKKKENTAQLSTNTNAAQAVVNAAAEEAAADATTHDDVPRIHAELKLEQLNIGTTAAQTIANAAAEKAAAGADAPERAVTEQTVIDAIEQAAINADAEAAATVNNSHDEIKRLQLLLTAERAAAAAARAAADEAAAMINSLEKENKRILLQLAAEQAATAVKVYVPGYNNPMTQTEHLAALQRQIQYLQEQLHAHAIPAQWRAHMAIMAETANVEEAVMASSCPVPPIANEPARGGEHTRAQTTALANLRSNSATYAEAVMSSVPDVKRRTSTNDNGRVHPANAASASATAGPEPARNSSVQQHKPAENLAAAALQAAADAAATAAEDPRILRAVLLAAAATASALAQAAPQDTVPTHRRGGRPPPTRRAKTRAWPRRTRRAPGTPAPTATGTSTAKQPRWTQQPTTASSPPREGRKARQQTGASTTASSNRAATSTMPATRNVPPKVEPTVMRLVNARD